MFFTLELHFDELLDMDDMPLLTLWSTLGVSRNTALGW